MFGEAGGGGRKGANGRCGRFEGRACCERNWTNSGLEHGFCVEAELDGRQQFALAGQNGWCVIVSQK